MKETKVELTGKYPMNMTEIPTDQEIKKPINVVVVNMPCTITIKEWDACIDVYISKERA